MFFLDTHTHFLASLAALIAACSSSVFSPAEGAASVDMKRAELGGLCRQDRDDDGDDELGASDVELGDEEKAETKI